ncbi:MULTISPECIES: sensor histidine kinase [Nostocales]|uniref:histidine kinase n=2 Tax=Nostocales TaxID=1161 RepID=A0A8S9T3E4_9CYAN|nr:CHASE3 domain-containing protein [Tolypothrix bouteillei]KAF3886487.1 PAS domain S-box protein [Tolypothrix bouteillei VB521301]
MKKLSEKIVLGGFSVALLILCSVGLPSYKKFQQLQQDKQWLIHTYQVLAIIDEVDDSLINAESGRRGYIITGNSLYLETYVENKPKIERTLKDLQKLTKDNVTQQNRLNKLQPLIAKRFASLDRSINLYQKNSSDIASQIAITNEDRAIRAKILAIRQELEAEEKRLLKQRLIVSNSSVNQVFILGSVGYTLSFLILIIVYWLLHKQIQLNKALSQEALYLEQQATKAQLANVLEQSERRYRSLVLATAQAVWTTDAQGLVVKNISSWTNLTGQKDEEVQGWGWLDAIHPEDRSQTAESWKTSVTSNTIYEIEHRVKVRDGTYRYFLARGIPVLDAEGLTVEWVGVHTDITERKLAQEQLQKANEELEMKVQQRTVELQKLNEELHSSNEQLVQFAYVASHDLQEPLRAVAGYSEMLRQEYQDCLDDSAKEYLVEIVDGGKRMQQLIQDLLAYSRVGTRTQELMPVDCNIVLKEVLKNLQVAIAEKDAMVIYDSLPTVMADKTQLLQLFQNLIGNAIKFCRQKQPQVHISAVKQENDWLFSVRDNGIGIKPQYLERIFEIFRRLHTRREFTGTGIGLAICKKIVERHGGQIWAESEPGVGTTFYFNLEAVSANQVPTAGKQPTGMDSPAIGD